MAETSREMVEGKGSHLFHKTLPLSYTARGSVSESCTETCSVTRFPQPLILSCTPSSSIKASMGSVGHVCHNLLGMVRSRYWRRGQKINKLDWAVRPRGRSPYPGLCSWGLTPLHQAAFPLYCLGYQIEFNHTVWLCLKEKGGNIFLSQDFYLFLKQSERFLIN